MTYFHPLSVGLSLSFYVSVWKSVWISLNLWTSRLFHRTTPMRIVQREVTLLMGPPFNSKIPTKQKWEPPTSWLTIRVSDLSCRCGFPPTRCLVKLVTVCDYAMYYSKWGVLAYPVGKLVDRWIIGLKFIGKIWQLFVRYSNEPVTPDWDASLGDRRTNLSGDWAAFRGRLLPNSPFDD